MKKAIEVLEERLALGQITPEEFHHRMSVLTSRPSVTPAGAIAGPPAPVFTAQSLTSTAQINVWVIAALGVVSAVIGWMIEREYRPSDHQVIEYFGRWSYGFVFAVLVGGALRLKDVISRHEWVTMIGFTGIGYIAARAFLESCMTDNISDLAALAAVASTIGAFIVFAGIKFTRKKVFSPWWSSLVALAILGVIGAAMVAAALSIENPSSDWPDDIRLMLLIHVPWQAAFGAILFHTLSTAPKR